MVEQVLCPSAWKLTPSTANISGPRVRFLSGSLLCHWHFFSLRYTHVISETGTQLVGNSCPLSLPLLAVTPRLLRQSDKGKRFKNYTVEILLFFHTYRKNTPTCTYPSHWFLHPSFSFWPVQPSGKLSVHSYGPQLPLIQPGHQYSSYWLSAVLGFPEWNLAPKTAWAKGQLRNCLGVGSFCRRGMCPVFT